MGGVDGAHEVYRGAQMDVDRRDKLAFPSFMSQLDAVVVGAGPNGLAAAITLARAQRSVLVLEAASEPGGSARTEELTRPGYLHDVCSAIHPMGIASPFMRELPLAAHGLEWIHPTAALAHPFDDGHAAVLTRSVDATADTLGEDVAAYRNFMGPLVRDWPKVDRALLSPFPPSVRHPLAMARYGLHALRSARGLVTRQFGGERAPGMFAGLAAHSILPLERVSSAAIGVVLGAVGHAVGWPLARGGSQNIIRAMTSYLESLGGQVQTGVHVRDLEELPSSRVVLCDVSPRGLVSIAKDRLPASYRRALTNFRHGPGVYKLDLALDGPVPWTAPECASAGTVHLGGSFDEIAQSEHECWAGKHAERPYVLVAQQSMFDDTRAPEGRHTLWAYCHVPHGSDRDHSEAIEKQIERFAPGFRDRILARHGRTARAYEEYNPNLVGGDIAGGVTDLGQLFTRPVPRWDPYSTPVDGLYICSASTPPGAGVHGMCGHHAARSALAHELS